MLYTDEMPPVFSGHAVTAVSKTQLPGELLESRIKPKVICAGVKDVAVARNFGGMDCTWCRCATRRAFLAGPASPRDDLAPAHDGWHPLEQF